MTKAPIIHNGESIVSWINDIGKTESTLSERRMTLDLYHTPNKKSAQNGLKT